MRAADPILQPFGQTRLGDVLNANLAEGKWTHFRAAIAFAKQSGANHIRDGLTAFARRAQVKISIGVDHQVTTREGVQALLAALNGRGEIWIFNNENRSTFHPKLYLFRNSAEALVAVGSGNLTEGGLFTNYEAGTVLSLDLSDPRDEALLRAFEVELDRWSNPAEGLAKLVTPEELARLIEGGYLPSEAQAREADRVRRRAAGGNGERRRPLFRSVSVPRAPTVTRSQPGGRPAPGPRGQVAEAAAAEGYSVFVMTLQQTDVGHGQTRPGASRRSPEIFIPLIARDYAAEFWGWPRHFSADRTKPGKMDRPEVRMRLGGAVINVHMWYNPVKKDLRLRSEALRSAGNVGDILRLEKIGGRGRFNYYAEIIPSGTAQYATYLQACSQSTRNSQKRWGYF